MEIKQFYDEALAHASYAIYSEGQIALVDPARNPQQYLQFAKEKGANVTAVLETHPHADFISSHLEWIAQHQVKVYINSKVGATYEHAAFEHGDTLEFGGVSFKTLFTPGHSPDHNTYLLYDEKGNAIAAFTGDALFVGDVGRPDLREGAGNIKVSKKELAEMMYATINTVFRELPDEVKVYPAHGPGSLCGKNMSPERSSTIGQEKANNWAFQLKEKEQFVASFLEGQAFIPHYFPYAVELNRKGAKSFQDATQAVSILPDGNAIPTGAMIVDVRSEEDFKAGHQANAFNIQLGEESSKFETWLGSTIKLEEEFYLVASNDVQMHEAIERAAKIGYETKIIGATTELSDKLKKQAQVEVSEVRENPARYHIIDVRNSTEFADGAFFENAKNIPLPELRERLEEINDDQPILVHCAGGYRSAVASSIIASQTDQKVYDLSDAVNEFK